jgi:hypothetical protein
MRSLMEPLLVGASSADPLTFVTIAVLFLIVDRSTAIRDD